jgi:hypothetical protein
MWGHNDDAVTQSQVRHLQQTLFGNVALNVCNATGRFGN